MSNSLPSPFTLLVSAVELNAESSVAVGNAKVIQLNVDLSTSSVIMSSADLLRFSPSLNYCTLTTEDIIPPDCRFSSNFGGDTVYISTSENDPVTSRERVVTSIGDARIKRTWNFMSSDIPISVIPVSEDNIVITTSHGLFDVNNGNTAYIEMISNYSSVVPISDSSFAYAIYTVDDPSSSKASNSIGVFVSGDRVSNVAYLDGVSLTRDISVRKDSPISLDISSFVFPTIFGISDVFGLYKSESSFTGLKVEKIMEFDPTVFSPHSLDIVNDSILLLSKSSLYEFDLKSKSLSHLWTSSSDLELRDLVVLYDTSTEMDLLRANLSDDPSPSASSSATSTSTLTPTSTSSSSSSSSSSYSWSASPSASASSTLSASFSSTSTASSTSSSSPSFSSSASSSVGASPSFSSSVSVTSTLSFSSSSSASPSPAVNNNPKNDSPPISAGGVVGILFAIIVVAVGIAFFIRYRQFKKNTAYLSQLKSGAYAQAVRSNSKADEATSRISITLPKGLAQKM